MKNTLIWTYRPPWNKEKAQCTNCWGYLKELSIIQQELHLSHTGQWLARTLTNENFTKGPAESTKAGLEEQKRSIRWVSLKCQPYDRLSYPVPYLFNHFVISEILFLSLSVRYQWSYTIIFKRKLGLRTLKSWWKNRNQMSLCSSQTIWNSLRRRLCSLEVQLTWSLKKLIFLF